MIIEDVLGSKTKLKVIKVLSESSAPLSLYYIQRKTGLRRSSLKSAIEGLSKAGLVREVEGLNVKKYEINSNSPEAKKLISCLIELGYINTRL